MIYYIVRGLLLNNKDVLVRSALAGTKKKHGCS